VDLLTDPLGSELLRRAAAELLILAAICGPMGVWVLLYRQAYAAESIAHAVLPGLVLASLAGIPLALGASGGVLAGAGLIALGSRTPRLGPDAAVAAVVTAFVGLGALLALSPEVPARLQELLFGDPLATAGSDLALAAATAAVGLAALAALHRTLALAAFDPVNARSLGGRPGLATGAVLVLLSLTVVAAVEALGSLLVVALIVAPAAAALRLTVRLVPALILSAALAALAGIAGLLASYHLDVAAGAAIALAAVAVYALSLAKRPALPVI
jgi:ABC-type Mn2+/Zn2+ transport system permease subunit